MQLIVLKPIPCEPEESRRLDGLWKRVSEDVGQPYGCIRTAENLRYELQKPQQLRFTRILVLAAIGETGINLELMAMLREIRLHPMCMEGRPLAAPSV